MARASVLFLPVFVVVYVAVVNALAALFVSASISAHEARHAQDPVWAARVARSACRHWRRGLSASESRQRAIRDHRAWPASVVSDSRSAAALLEATLAASCPGMQAGKAAP